MNDPVQEILEQISSVRKNISKQVMYVPGPNPVRKTLQDIDSKLDSLERQVRTNLPKPPTPPDPHALLNSFNAGKLSYIKK